MEDEFAAVGHFTQRLSGVSRLRIERIFGGTTLDIQFMSVLASVSCPRKRASSSTSRRPFCIPDLPG